MSTYKYLSKFTQRYDLNLRQTAANTIRYESVRPPHGERTIIRYAVLPFRRYVEKSFLSSVAYNGLFFANGIFDCKGKQFYVSPDKFDGISYRSGAKFRYTNDFLIRQKNGIRQRFDAIDLYPVPRKNRFRGSCDLFVSVRYKFFARFSCGNIAPREKYPLRFDRLQLKRVKNHVRWNAIPCDFLFKEFLRFDSVKKEFSKLPVWHQALFRPGWNILARNIETEELFDLGFIVSDEVNPALGDVFLSDGDYEISVLTSSLFWKDCLDNNIRTLSIRPGEQATPLPTIYNLRSAVLQGTTTIRWSANRSDVNDCVFGVWYSNESPVDVNRPCDMTVWYFSSQSEYQTSFKQTAPCYVAVASMRTGNETELGKVHELYLDWSNITPRCPDDVVIFDQSLPAIDPIPLENEDGYTRWE